MDPHLVQSTRCRIRAQPQHLSGVVDRQPIEEDELGDLAARRGQPADGFVDLLQQLGGEQIGFRPEMDVVGAPLIGCVDESPQVRAVDVELRVEQFGGVGIGVKPLGAIACREVVYSALEGA